MTDDQIQKYIDEWKASGDFPSDDEIIRETRGPLPSKSELQEYLDKVTVDAIRASVLESQMHIVAGRDCVRNACKGWLLFLIAVPYVWGTSEYEHGTP